MNDTINVSDNFDRGSMTEKRQPSIVSLPNKFKMEQKKTTSSLGAFKIPEVEGKNNTSEEKSSKKKIKNGYDSQEPSQLDDLKKTKEVNPEACDLAATTNSKNVSNADHFVSLASFSKVEKAKLIANDRPQIKEGVISPLRGIAESSAIPKSNSVCVKATYIEQSGRVARTGDLGAVQPKQLAKNLFNLVNITKNQVTPILTRSDAYHTEACKEYMNLFPVENLRVDEALRLLMKQIPFIGETHSIEKMLTHFTHRYWIVNKDKLHFSEAVCHLLLCSILILNSDLHSKIKMKKMSLEEYMQNFYSVCNPGEALPDKEYLTNIYKQIRKKSLPTHIVETKKPLPSFKVPNYSSTTLMPRLVKNDFTVAKTGAVYWKEYRQSGIFKSIGNAWKLTYISILGSDLIFHKNPSIASIPTLIVSLTHSFAKTYIKPASKRQTLMLVLITGKSYLFSDTLQSSVADWITHINVAAALLTSLPLPLSLGNPPFYTKLLSYSTQPYTGSIKDLYIHILNREKELENILKLNIAYIPAPDEKIAAAQSIALIQHEIDRYGKYKMILKNSKKEFLQKFLPSESKSLEGFQEYIEKEIDAEKKIDAEKEIVAEKEIDAEKEIVAEKEIHAEKEIDTEKEINTEKEIDAEKEIDTENDKITITNAEG